MKSSNAKLTATFTRFVLVTLTIVMILLAADRFAHAQVLYGTLVGRVEDQSGAVLSGATVKVTNQATGQQREATTDESGAYAFRDLQAGVYDLRVGQSGFKTYAKDSLSVTINTSAL